MFVILLGAVAGWIVDVGKPERPPARGGRGAHEGSKFGRRALPLGYYKDPEKSAKTFRVIDGKRYSIPGDWATVDADGTLRLLGRGSVCINTGGEKVFPEEVEEVLKTHAAVRDALVVGVPDEKFVEAICAVVELDTAAAPPGPAELIAHVKTRLASFKAPKHVLIVDTVGRAPNGKADYPRVRREAAAAVAARA